MKKPKFVQLTCDYCGHQWNEPLASLLAQQEVIYRDDNKTVRRSVVCPNCQKLVYVDVPAAWVEDE